MAMKHTTLPLAREGVEGEEEKEEHHTTKCPRPCLRRPDTVRSKVHVLSGHHEGGDTKPYQDSDRIVIHWVRLVAQVLTHEHDGHEFEAFEEHLRRERHVLQRLILAPAGQHI